MINIQRAVESIKGNDAFCHEAISDIEYGLSLSSDVALSSHFRNWLEGVDNPSQLGQDADYYRTIKYIHEHSKEIN